MLCVCVCLCVRACVYVTEREKERFTWRKRVYLCVNLFSFLPPFLLSFFLSQTTDQLHILWQFPEDELQIFVDRAEKKQNKTRKTRAEGGKK